MGKFDLDNLLAELGVKPGDAQPKRLPQKPDTEPKRRHEIDKAESSFTPIPAVPTGQRSYNENITVEHDPAVPVQPAGAAHEPHSESLSSIWAPDTHAPAHAHGPGPSLADYLLSSGAATEQQLNAAQQVLKQSPGRRLPELVVEQGALEANVQKAVAHVANLPFEPIDLSKGLDGGFDGKLLQRLTIDFCKQHLVVPLRVEGSRVLVGVVRPDDVFLLDEVRRRLGVASVKLIVVTGFDVRGALEIAGAKASNESAMDVSKILSEVQDTDVQVEKKETQEIDLEKEAAESPVIKYVNYIIQTASSEGASDIHIEPAEKSMKVRFRIDGELYEMMQPPASMSAAITSRLKIMANLDISERRLPQDGRIRCTVSSRRLDLRMSTLPCAYGEKVVLRILDTRSINVKLEDLGFGDDMLRIWRGLIDAPHGIVLVTGPTGSGKTTTLYSSLRQLDKSAMNISTVEDPIEYHLEGITQCQMHDKIGMSFEKALKALLRQDPDVIMLGEIRDKETAVTAVQAALTGHLVLSTLHTNDAPSSITRLVNIGLESFLVAAAVNGVLAQRLVRRLCKECKHEAAAPAEMEDFLQVQGMPTDKIWTAKGCEKCRKSGFSGRVGLYELLAVDDQLRDIIVGSPNVSELRRLCTERGMVNLRTDGLRKAAKGLTSIQEVLRITESTI